MYLMHYAEVKHELALLSINNFQKDMGNDSQLIRALALRVMSSIRVRVIIGLQILAVKKCASDPSPYVRKTAAHAIPKIFRVDEERKEELVDVIVLLLNDKSTLVLGSAVAAFIEVCPDRYDLLHEHYRKLCHLLADIDEWGQTMLLNLLLRYARTQFLSPFGESGNAIPASDNSKFFDSSSSDEDEDGNGGDGEAKEKVKEYRMDADHELLLKAAIPLTQSRNSGVVLAVAALYAYLAPPYEATKVGKSLVRILRNRPEIQYVVLANIATLAATRADMFEPYIKDFFVLGSDPQYVRLLKLEILTMVVRQNNISLVLKEFKEYVRSPDKQFVTATVQAIGRCSFVVPDVADTCLSGLMGLLNNPSQAVVAEAVVVMKTLLQQHPSQHKHFVNQIARLLDNITVPMARGAIVWMIGEYCTEIPLLAPDALRRLAKTFAAEDVFVKNQILNMAAKVFLNNPAQTTLLLHYVLDLAKFDLNYDLRDRSRLLRGLLVDTDAALKDQCRAIFLTEKPAPVLSNPTADRNEWTLNTLSHVVNQLVPGYEPLPDFPTEQPPSDVRKVAANPYAAGGSGSADVGESGRRRKTKRERGFYSDSDSSSSSSYYSSSSSSSSGSSSTSSSGSSSSGSSSSGSSSSSSSSSSGSSSSSSSSSSGKPAKAKQGKGNATGVHADLKDLMGFDSPAPAADRADYASVLSPAATSSPGMDVFASAGSAPVAAAAATTAGRTLASHTSPQFELLNRVKGAGLQIDAVFVRSASPYGAKFTTVRLTLTNTIDEPVQAIGAKVDGLADGRQMYPFTELGVLAPQMGEQANLHVDFNEKTTPVKFEIYSSKGTFPVSLTPLVGEMMRPHDMARADFDAAQKRLAGMHEAAVTLPADAAVGEELADGILRKANMSLIHQAADRLLFAAMLGDSLVLLDVDASSGSATAKVNCDNAMLVSTIQKQLS